MKNKSILLKDLKQAIVDVLHKHDKLYHFEDCATELVDGQTGQPTFTSDEAWRVNSIVGVLRDEQMFTMALKKHNPICPECEDINCAWCGDFKDE